MDTETNQIGDTNVDAIMTQRNDELRSLSEQIDGFRTIRDAISDDAFTETERRVVADTIANLEQTHADLSERLRHDLNSLVTRIAAIENQLDRRSSILDALLGKLDVPACIACIDGFCAHQVQLQQEIEQCKRSLRR